MKLYLRKRRYKAQSLLERQKSLNLTKSKDMTLNGSDMSLLQILQSLQNENDCVSVATTPPRMVISTTSSNEAINEHKVKMTRLLPK